MTRIEGKVAAIIDSTTVVINRGSAHGVERGDKFYIYYKLGPFSDPDSHEDLGEITRILGKVEVVSVEPKLSLARSEYRGSLMLSFSMSQMGGRSELPIDERQVLRPDTIQVGELVYCEKSSSRNTSKDVSVSGPPGSD